MSDKLTDLRYSMALEMCLQHKNVNVSSEEFQTLLLAKIWNLSVGGIDHLIHIATIYRLSILTELKIANESNKIFTKQLSSKFNTKIYPQHSLLRHQLRVSSVSCEESTLFDTDKLQTLVLTGNELHRQELLMCSAYFGVIKKSDSHDDVNFIRYERYVSSQFFICEHNTWDSFVTRAYLSCDFGGRNELIILYKLNKWSFYTSYGKHDDCRLDDYITVDDRLDELGEPLPRELLVRMHKIQFLNYENKCFGLYDTLESMVVAIEQDYICPCCYFSLNPPQTEIPVLNNICALKRLRRAELSKPIWNLQKMCAFYIQNYFYNKKPLIRQILPSHIFKYIERDGGSFDERIFSDDYTDNKMWI